MTYVSPYVNLADMAGLPDYGGLLLGSRLRRATEDLFAGVDAVYRAHGVELSSRAFPVLFLLRDIGPVGITELAAHLGQSHPAVSQLSRTLLEHGVVTARADPADERRRLLALTARGTAMMEKLAPIWRALVGAVADLGSDAGIDLVAAVGALEAALARRAFADRITDRLALARAETVEIIPFEPRYRDDFRRLNVEWLERYFYVEALDHQVLSHPEESILAPGGFIFLARWRQEIVGTVALIKAGRGRYELSKMAVTERCQGMGIGRRLLSAALAQFRKTGAPTLYLESNSKMKPALALYESSGFRQATPPRAHSQYRRSDVYMVYRDRPRRRR